MSTNNFSGLEKAYKALITLLFTYGDTHLLAIAKNWWNTCVECKMDVRDFKNGLSLEIAVVLKHLTGDLYWYTISRYDSPQAKQLRNSIKLVGKLL